MKYFITLILLVAGVYVAVASYSATRMLQRNEVKRTSSLTEKTFEYNGLVFRDEQSLNDFLEEQQSNRWFGWIFSLPANLVLFVGCMAAGLFGGSLRVVINLARQTAHIKLINVILDPTIGLGMGVVLFFFSLALPAIFSSGAGPVRPETALVFSISGGLFSEQAHKWLETQVARVVFQSKPKSRSNKGGSSD